MIDLAPDDPWEFSVLVITPEQNPPGPREQDVRLGAEFFRHYACRILVSYGAIRYRDEEGTDRRGIDPSIPCGYLEKP